MAKEAWQILLMCCSTHNAVAHSATKWCFGAAKSQRCHVERLLRGTCAENRSNHHQGSVDGQRDEDYQRQEHITPSSTATAAAASATSTSTPTPTPPRPTPTHHHQQQHQQHHRQQQQLQSQLRAAHLFLVLLLRVSPVGLHDFHPVKSPHLYRTPFKGVAYDT